MSKLGDPGDTPHHIPGNMSPGELGGDNSPGGEPHAIEGNPPVGSVMDHDYGHQGDKPLRVIEGNPDRHEVKSMFRGGD